MATYLGQNITEVSPVAEIPVVHNMWLCLMVGSVIAGMIFTRRDTKNNNYLVILYFVHYLILACSAMYIRFLIENWSYLGLSCISAVFIYSVISLILSLSKLDSKLSKLDFAVL